jgi:hypothetical protein
VKALLGWLLWLFPESFRERFGAAILEHAALDCERDRRGGRLAGARSLLATAADIARSGVAERLRPSWSGVPVEKGRPMSIALNGWATELRHTDREHGLARIRHKLFLIRVNPSSSV